MLICPQCQSENSDANKFCQSCGTSLTNKSCYACGAQVAHDALNCPKCGALTGTVLRAIVTLTGPCDDPDILPLITEEVDEDATMPLFSLTQNPTDAVQVPPAPPSKPVEATAAPSQPPKYLDLQQRYLLIEPLQPVNAARSELQARVLDCHPLQISLLEAMQGQTTATPPVPGSLPMIPPMAELYLELQPELGQTLPEVRDAWVQENRAVLLVEDRSEWPMLIDLWRDEDLSIQQIVFLLFEMVKLWESLESLRCRQSLLIQENVRVDEDQVIGLQSLYAESLHQPLSLKDLGVFWKELFEQSQQTYIGSLVIVLEQLERGEIQSIEELQLHLRAIAEELEFNTKSNLLDFDEDDSQPQTVPDANIPSPVLTQGAAPSLPTTLSVSASAPTRLQGSPAAPERTNEANDDQPTVVLPMQLFNLENVGLTDTGTQRNHNEDAFCIQTKIERIETKTGRTLYAKGLYILCDGMGGHAGGEVASALAVDTLRKYFQLHWFNRPDQANQLPSEDAIREAVKLANQAIYEINQQQARTGSGRMGTTLVLVLVQDTNVAVTHVGDSRLYQLTRKQGLTAVTQDHDVGQREIQRGVEPSLAYARPDAYQLTQALGPRSDDYIKPDIQFLELNEDTLLILSSDGLTDNDLLEKNFSTHLAPLLSSRVSLEKGVSDLIELGNQYNGHDNITVVLIRAKVRPNLDNLKD